MTRGTEFTQPMPEPTKPDVNIQSSRLIPPKDLAPIDPSKCVEELFEVAQSMGTRTGVPMTTEIIEGGIKISPRTGEDLVGNLPPIPPKADSDSNARKHAQKDKKPSQSLLDKRRRRQANVALLSGLHNGTMYEKGRPRGKNGKH